MSDVGLGLSYWLPQTRFQATITRRHVVETSSAGCSSVKTVADVHIVPAPVADPSSRQALTIEAGLLEKVSLKIDLDDRGFIWSVNGESGRDLSPVLNVIGKAIGVAGTVVAGLREAAPSIEEGPPQPLEEQWAKSHARLSAQLRSLEAKAQTLLSRIGDEDTTAEETHQLGQALRVVQDQLAAISETKRAWIAGHNETVLTRCFTLQPDELVRLEGPKFPPTIAGFDMSAAIAAIVKDFGVLIAIIDRDRAVRDRVESGDHAPQALVDKLALRRSRPVTIGVYLRAEDDAWSLEPGSVVSMDIVDHFSETDYLPLDGSWLRTKGFELAYHPDMSLKTFGVSAASNASAVATSLGDILDATAQAGKHLAERPGAAEQELAKAKTQLDLLKTANEFEVPAATRAKAAELAALEQQRKLHDLGA